jgi:hypothetical protein
MSVADSVFNVSVTVTVLAIDPLLNSLSSTFHFPYMDIITHLFLFVQEF